MATENSVASGPSMSWNWKQPGGGEPGMPELEVSLEASPQAALMLVGESPALLLFPLLFQFAKDDTFENTTTRQLDKWPRVECWTSVYCRSHVMSSAWWQFSATALGSAERVPTMKVDCVSAELQSHVQKAPLA